MAAVSLLGMTGAASFAVSAAESVLPEEMQTETIDDSGEETDIPRIPDMVVGSFDETADGMPKVPEDETETEIDWTVFAPELDENGEFHLDEGYIEAYDVDLCSDIIFYGDSRVVGMAYLTGGYHYVGKESTGTAWMEGEGLSYLESQMKAWPEADIVFCFGVNDPGQIGNTSVFIPCFLKSIRRKDSGFCPSIRCMTDALPITDTMPAIIRSNSSMRNCAKHFRNSFWTAIPI